MKIKGQPVEFVQDDWEGGFTVFVPPDLPTNDDLHMSLQLDGDFLTEPQGLSVAGCYYPLSNESWYPRHGFLDRASYDLTFRHKKNVKVVSGGTRTSERPADDNKDVIVTTYQLPQQVPFVSFALGPFVRHSELIKWDKGGEPTPLEFDSLDTLEINEPLMMAEMNNAVRYFHNLFGPYPYASLTAAYHPYDYGQGFAAFIMVPSANNDDRGTFSFLSHETAHQWWGNAVAWRSYRDQWLSEGFAEYSGVIYTNLRKNPKEGKKLIDNMRQALREPPINGMAYGKGKLAESGPLILGHRLSTRKNRAGYSVLVYSKGALVLRMLHFLMTDPASGDGQPFYDMMKDFVEAYRDKTASTEDFRAVANRHFALSVNARRYGLKDLNWFFKEWVFNTEMPSYKLEYKVEKQPDGSAILSGNVFQEDVPADWGMILPVTVKFGAGKFAVVTVAAAGPKYPFSIKLPQAPEKVELDPDRWILSDKTTTEEVH